MGEVKNLWDKKWFFGWENIKWLLRELLKLGSDQPSFFSQKRVHQGIAIVIFFGGWICVLIYLLRRDTEIYEFVQWGLVLLALCGYTLKVIQDEKREKNNSEK